MTPEVAKFWEEVRLELLRVYGQDPGKRDREKALQRERLAKEFRLSSRTLKGFLNRNQKGLGEQARFALFAKMPAFELRYRQATGGQMVVPVSRNGAAEYKDDRGLYIQLTLQIEGFDDPSPPITARLTPGREGILTLKIDAGRVA